MKNIKGASYIGNPVSNTVVYITKKVDYLIANLEKVSNCKVFIESSVEIPDKLKKQHEFVYSDMPQRDYAEFVYIMAKEKFEKNKKRKYILSAENYIIGENVILGKDCHIEPGCFIDHDVVIGDKAYIKTGSRIKNAIIGNNFVACENCTIGTDGFTVTVDENGNKMKIPSLGKVIIGNNVEVNALSNISCGTAGNTVIQDNVKIDSLVYIGHDVYVGDNVEVTAGAIIGGFDVLENNSYVGINATLRNRIKIGEASFVGMGAVVTKSIDERVTVVGNPARLFMR